MADVDGTNNGIIDLGDLVPEIIPVCRVTRDEKKIVLKGYVFGRRIPVTKKAELKQIVDKHRSASINPDTGLSEYSDALFAGYMRDSLMSLIDSSCNTGTGGLSFDEADLIASDDDLVIPLLRKLNYWSTPDEALEAMQKKEDDEDDEGKALKEELQTTA